VLDYFSLLVWPSVFLNGSVEENTLRRRWTPLGRVGDLSNFSLFFEVKETLNPWCSSISEQPQIISRDFLSPPIIPSAPFPPVFCFFGVWCWVPLSLIISQELIVLVFKRSEKTPLPSSSVIFQKDIYAFLPGDPEPAGPDPRWSYVLSLLAGSNPVTRMRAAVISLHLGRLRTSHRPGECT